MKIEIRDELEEDNYILNVPTIKITYDNGFSEIFISSQFTSWQGLLVIHMENEIKESEEEFIKFMLDPSTVELVNWASSICDYSYNHTELCPIWSEKNDRIWENLIKFGIVELKEKA